VPVTVRIANVQAFWGDAVDAPGRLLDSASVDYLTLDYLAEVTMSILAKARARPDGAGYAADFVRVARDVLPTCRERGTKIVTNAGGLDPVGCASAVGAVATELGLEGVQVASVTGDDLMPSIDSLLAEGINLENLETGEPITSIRDALVCANAYLGAQPIVDGLASGADIVITGRCTDPSLVTAPLVYSYNWAMDDYDRIASAMVAGHIIECGSQVTGGNFDGQWWDVELEEIGYPIVEFAESGEFVITKPAASGGLVSFHTVMEQLLYELGDPHAFVGPDVVADLGQARLEEVGRNRVRASALRGTAPPDTYKVSAAFRDGYMIEGTLAYAWPNALGKARRAGALFQRRLDVLGLEYERLHLEYFGHDALLGRLSPTAREEPAEVMLRVAVHGYDRDVLIRIGMELAPLALNGPAGATGFASGRPRPRDVVSFWPALVPKEAVTPHVELSRTVQR
jgi:hypothetical protein